LSPAVQSTPTITQKSYGFISIALFLYPFAYTPLSVIRSNFGATSKNWYEIAVKLLRPFLISNEKGAATSIYLASDKNETSNGKYFIRKK
jgi:hypothetical protein